MDDGAGQVASCMLTVGVWHLFHTHKVAQLSGWPVDVHVQLQWPALAVRPTKLCFQLLQCKRTGGSDDNDVDDGVVWQLFVGWIFDALFTFVDITFIFSVTRARRAFPVSSGGVITTTSCSHHAPYRQH